MHRACVITALEDVSDYFTREQGQVAVSSTENCSSTYKSQEQLMQCHNENVQKVFTTDERRDSYHVNVQLFVQITAFYACAECA